ncbi:MAG: MBL fold metallo-hydrolase [Defluviitaleaceae bacterium]|nr:MBL fold metallo-hydrolase [Defluviitaleaceae bacterium]
MKAKIYGCRGSIPVSHTYCSRYGGNTACMTVESKGKTLIFDAGSGLMIWEQEMKEIYPNYPKGMENPPKILISHLHLDHIIALGNFAHSWDPESSMVLYTASRDERSLKEQIFGVFKPPYWPHDMAKISGAECVEIKCGEPIQIDHFTVTPFVANHPDQTMSYHITDGEKSVVHLLDCEIEGMNEKMTADMLKYCSDVDLIVFDAAYSSEDYPKHVGWGHSTVEQGVELAKKTKPRAMIFAHLNQSYRDYELDTWTRHFDKAPDTYFMLARDNSELEL